MPKRLGPKRLGPKRLGAETSRGRNGLVPKRLVTHKTLNLCKAVNHHMPRASGQILSNNKRNWLLMAVHSSALT